MMFIFLYTFPSNFTVKADHKQLSVMVEFNILLLGFYEDDAFVLLFYLLCTNVLCMCCLSGVIKNNNK